MSFSKIKARNALHNGQFNIKFSNCLKISCVVFMKTRRQEYEKTRRLSALDGIQLECTVRQFFFLYHLRIVRMANGRIVFSND